jgi:REP element-mobilizing transposase RayT
MARTNRGEVFAADEIAVVHVMNRVVRRCFLMGDDPVSGKNFDHRKQWIEDEIERSAAHFGIDLIAFSLLSNHMHLILRSRPDVVATWDASEVARRWWMLCPKRKDAQGRAEQPSEAELNLIRLDPEKLLEIRSRLSNISWWMRLLCQRIAQRANREDEMDGKFWQSRYRGVRLLDEQAILAAAAYVDLNPIRAAVAQTVEGSDFTSVQRRVRSLVEDAARAYSANEGLIEHAESEATQPKSSPSRPDRWLAPVEIKAVRDALGAMPSSSSYRCSDKGFASMSSADYVQLLDWTARQLAAGKRGSTPMEAPAVFDRLQIKPVVWCDLVTNFGRLFSLIAGQPHRVDAFRSLKRRGRFHLRRAARQLLAA